MQANSILKHAEGFQGENLRSDNSGVKGFRTLSLLTCEVFNWFVPYVRMVVMERCGI